MTTVPAHDPAARFSVSDSLVGQRVDRALALVTGWTRAEIGTLCADGAVTVDGAPVVKAHRLTPGVVVEAWSAPPDTGPPEPDSGVVIDVVYEDRDLVVIDKAAGVVVHPGVGHHTGTLVNGLLARYPEIAGVGDEPERPGIVHRLDRDTSGLLVVARTESARIALADALRRHDVGRHYLALVHGVPSSARGLIDAPVGRSPRRPTRQAVRAGGKSARTRYERRESFSSASAALLECTLETGRTHQIRVHLAAIGHPVAGDPFYGAPPPTRGPLADLDRPFLHAARLDMMHPTTGQALSFESALPGALAGILDRLRGGE